MLRVVTLNIHKGFSQFNRRVVIHELREGLRLLRPDLVFLQEVQGLNERHALRYASWPGQGQHEFLAGEELQHVYGRNRVHQHGHYGNALLSRHPILSHENADISDHRFERRGMLHSVVKVPGWKRNLHCLCVHLWLLALDERRQACCDGIELTRARERDPRGQPRHDRGVGRVARPPRPHLPEPDAAAAAGPHLRARPAREGSEGAPRPALVATVGSPRAQRGARACLTTSAATASRC